MNIKSIEKSLTKDTFLYIINNVSIIMMKGFDYMKILKKAAIILTAAITMGGITNMPVICNTAVEASASALKYGDWWYSVSSDGTVIISQYDGDEEIVTVPSQINGRTVSEIGNSALLGSTYPADVKKEIILPNTIKRIGNTAFSNCKKLEKIIIPDSVKEIGVRAFINCSSLKSINLNKVEKLGFGVFEDCTLLEQMYVPGTIKTIPERAFHNCTNLKSLTIGDGVTTIETKAALNTPSLQKIVIPDSVTSIGEYAFGYTMEQTTSYTKYISAVENIKEYGFGQDTAAEQYGIDNGIIKVFEGSISDENILIPGTPPPIISRTKGDADGSGSVDSSDASIVLAEYSAIQTGKESSLTVIQKRLCDVNMDGTVDPSDASEILRYYSDASTGKTPTWSITSDIINKF